jgi:hypothetical protein
VVDAVAHFTARLSMLLESRAVAVFKRQQAFGIIGLQRADFHRCAAR